MKESLMKLLKPDYCFSTLAEIEVNWLFSHGFRNIILDVDNTLLPQSMTSIPAKNLAWLEKVIEEGISVVLLSNNGGRRLDMIEEITCLKAVRWAIKPVPIAFSRAMKLLKKENSYFGLCSGNCSGCSDCSACSDCSVCAGDFPAVDFGNAVVVIGDQLFTDVLGAHLYGIPAIQVKQLSG